MFTSLPREKTNVFSKVKNRQKKRRKEGLYKTYFLYFSEKNGYNSNYKFYSCAGNEEIT